MNEFAQRKLMDTKPLVEGVVKLFSPFVEGAIHDLESGKIVALYNNMSRRKVGDVSAISELGVPTEQFPDVFEPYYKTNWDGRKLKCVSITLRNEKGRPIGLVCLNFDTSAIGDVSAQLQQLVAVKSASTLNPVEAFSKSWQKQVDAQINAYLDEKSVAASALTKAQKQELVTRLFDHGIFNFRGAASAVGKRLGVSRATVYNYLKGQS